MATVLGNLSKNNFDDLPDVSKYKIHLIVSEWNKDITQSLARGAQETLIKAGVHPDNIVYWPVPGSFELIFGAKKAQEKKPNAVITIGSLIQGETKHFDFICKAVTQGVKDLNVLSEIPVIFCVLTDNTIQQAKERSGGKYGNKGVEAAFAALKMAQLNER